MSRLFNGAPELDGNPPFQDMVEAAPTAMILVDGEGRILLVNAEAERMFGYPRAALQGQPVERLVPDASRAGHAIQRKAYVVAPTKRTMGGNRPLRGLRADGAEFPVEVALSPLVTPAYACVLAIVQDVTERSRAEAERGYLAAIVESTDDAIIGKTLDGVVTSWNRAAETILGWSEQEMIGQRIIRIIPADRREEESRILACICSGGRVEDLATVRQRRDHTLIPVSITVSPIRDREGRVIGASKILRDATERHRGERAMQYANAMLERAVAERTQELAAQQDARLQAEAALAQAQKLEAVGHLTGGVAHDFNNLLTVVAGNLDLIKRRAGADERLGRSVAAISRAVERGARLTSHLLAFARQQSLSPEVMRLDDAAREFSVLTMRALGEAVRLSIDADPDLLDCRIDRAQFESAMLNLSLNARDAMPNGGTLALTFRNVSDGAGPMPGRYVSVEVADTGAGMPPEVIARAVEPFFTTKQIGKGSGLGLSQVYGFVRQSGGVLRIDSGPGKGTRVTMLFPAVDTAPRAPAADMELPAATPD